MEIAHGERGPPPPPPRAHLGNAANAPWIRLVDAPYGQEARCMLCSKLADAGHLESAAHKENAKQPQNAGWKKEYMPSFFEGQTLPIGMSVQSQETSAPLSGAVHGTGFASFVHHGAGVPVSPSVRQQTQLQHHQHIAPSQAAQPLPLQQQHSPCQASPSPQLHRSVHAEELENRTHQQREQAVGSSRGVTLPQHNQYNHADAVQTPQVLQDRNSGEHVAACPQQMQQPQHHHHAAPHPLAAPLLQQQYHSNHAAAYPAQTTNAQQQSTYAQQQQQTVPLPLQPRNLDAQQLSQHFFQ